MRQGMVRFTQRARPGAGPGGSPRGGPGPARACPGGPGGGQVAQRMPDLDDLYRRLAEAVEAGDADVLSALAWQLYGLLGLDEADLKALRSRLHQLPGPAGGGA